MLINLTVIKEKCQYHFADNKSFELMHTLIGDVCVVTGGDAEGASDGPFDAVSSSLSFPIRAAPPFFFFSFASNDDSLSGNGGISSSTD